LEGVETVYHVAGEARENRPTEQYFDVNHVGTKNILDSFVKNGGKYFLHVSTVGVYGYKPPSGRIKEDAPKNVKHPYHSSKWLAEQEVFSYSKKHNFFASAVRPPYIIGPRDRQMAPNLFEFLVKGKTIPLISGGKCQLSFVHHKDLAKAMIMCKDSEKANGEAFNVSGGEITVKELFDTLGKISNREPKYLRINYYIAYFFGMISEIIAKIKKERPKITRRRVKQFTISRIYDTSKTKRLTGFEPQSTVRDALEDAYNWMKEEKLV
jgi:nucleoside-diphosphate-sugar epimerase